MSHKPLRIGVIGCGGIAQMMHLPTLSERPDLFEIVALADVRADTLEAVGRRYGVRELTTDSLAVIQNPNVEAVILSAGGSHHALTIAALEAGKHIFVEKPLGYSIQEIEEIGRVARGSKAQLMVGYHKRFDPSFLRARELVREMGDLRLVEVTVLHPEDGAYREHHAILPISTKAPAPFDEAQDLKNAATAVTEGAITPRITELLGAQAPIEQRVATKVLLESLIHDINVVRGIIGEPEKVHAASVWRGGFAQTSTSEFANGVHVNMSWVMVPGVRNYEERIRFVAPDRRVTLVFPSPYLRHAPTPLIIERMDGGDHVLEQRTVSYEEAFRAELHHFRQAILENRTPEVSVEEALGDARWIQKIVQAF